MGRRALLALALAAASGCGYRFGAPSASLPKGIRQVFVPVLANRTAEPLVEGWLTEALREAAARSGFLGGSAAEGTLEGAVVSVSAAPIAAGPGRLPTYRLGLTVEVKLKQGEAVLATALVTQTEDFTSGADVLLTEANRAAALRRLCELVAREAWERLSS